MIFTRYVLAADMVETWRLWATVDAWWPAIEVLIRPGSPSARILSLAHHHRPTTKKRR
jgi:hypothetical protein